MALKAAAAVALIACAASPAWASGVRDAQAAYDAGHYAEARRLWEEGAAAGDPASQLGLGLLCDLGQGGPRDPACALRWYRAAAEAGLPDAEFNTGVLLDAGDGVPRNATQAALWYGRAAAHGNHRAQYDLGLLYASGDGVPRNLDQAEAWFTAAQALPAASARLAALRRSARPALPVDAEAQPRAARIAAPGDGGAVAAPDGVELVWTAPPQPMPVRYFVQVTTPDATREMFADTVAETAVLAKVSAPGRYAWRVFTVAPERRAYAASDWATFEVR